MGANLRLPNLTGGSTQEQLIQMRSYLYQLVQQLNAALDAYAQETGSAVRKVSKKVDDSEKTPEASFNEIKALIIKSADVVNAIGGVVAGQLSGSFVDSEYFQKYMQEQERALQEATAELEQKVADGYVAAEEYEAYIQETEKALEDAAAEILEETTNTIEQTAEGIKQEVSRDYVEKTAFETFAEESNAVLEQTAEKIRQEVSSLYVKQTEFDLYAEENASVIQQTAESIRQEVSGTYVDKTEFETGVQNAVDGIEVGGRNLIPNSMNKHSSDTWSDWYTPRTGVNRCYADGSFTFPEGTKVGDVFTISIEMEWTDFAASSDGTLDGPRIQQYWNSSWSSGIPNILPVFIKRDSTSAAVKTAAHTFTITKDTQVTGTVMYYFRTDYSDGTGKFRIRRLKLEKGNKATDWTPAPEDVEQAISLVRSDSKSLIEQTASSIRQEVSSDYVKQTEFEAYSEENSTVIEQTAEGVKQEIAASYVKQTEFGTYAVETEQQLQETAAGLRREMESAYLAKSEFGTYSENMERELQETAAGLEQVFTNIQAIVTDVAVLEHNLIGVQAHVNSGLLYYDSAGVPVYGMEIGQRTALDGVEIFRKYARFTADRLSFFDQNDSEVAYISDQKLYITQVEITGSLRMGGFVSTVDAAGGIVKKWIGKGA